MTKNYLSIFLKTGVLAILFCVANFFLLHFNVIPHAPYHYPIPVVYLFFWIFTLVIVSILTKIGEKNVAQVGYAFLLLTGVKMAASYFFAKPILAKTIEFPTEKANFFAVFVLFLAIEAYFTVRLLNNKQ